MTHLKLVHTNPTLNDPKMWYRLIDDTNPTWYFATIWGPNGMVNSVIHAVPKEDYRLQAVVVAEKDVTDANEFI